MTIKSSILNDRQKAVIETIRMRLNEKQSLEYLKEVGFDIGPATYYREKRKVEQMKLKRLYHIAKIGFEDQHLDRIDIYEMGFKMMWQNVLLEKDPYKRNSMIKDILLLQPYLSAYYEATKLIIDKQQQSEYKGYLDKHVQEREQEQEDGDEEELNGVSHNKYQQQESTTTLTNKESSRMESTTDDYYEENKNRKYSL